MKSGTWREWKREVASPLAGQHLPMIAVLAAFAAPLQQLTGETTNIGFEFTGAPATGKTTCLLVMGSVAGHPNNMPSFNSTTAGLEAAMAEYRDRAFPVDEGSLKSDRSPQSIKDFIFRMSQGTPKVTAFNHSRQQYRFIYATTTNAPFADDLTPLDRATADAAMQRLISLRVGDPPLGVFNHIPDQFTSSGEFARTLNERVSHYHGSALPRYIRHVLSEQANGRDALKQKLQSSLAEFERRVGVSVTGEGHSRVSNALGLLYAAGELAKRSQVLPDNWDCMAACVAAYRNYQTQRPQMMPIVTRLLTIAQRPETLDLRDGNLPILSRTAVERHGAFLKCGRKGRIEFLLTDGVVRDFFPDLATLSRSQEFKALNIREKQHRTKQRQIRKGHVRERFHCFVLPPALVEAIDS